MVRERKTDLETECVCVGGGEGWGGRLTRKGKTEWRRQKD